MRRRGYMFQATKMADVNLKGGMEVLTFPYINCLFSKFQIDYSNVDNSPIVKGTLL